MTDEEKKARKAAYQKRWREKNKEHIAEYQKTYMANGWKEKRATWLKANSQKKLERDDKRREYEKQYKEKNQERFKAAVSAAQKRYREKHGYKYRDRAEYQRKYRATLNDSVIAHELRIPVSECPKDLIELKRQQLKLVQLTRQLNQAIKEQENAE